jgi:hypothetical protein
LVLNSYMYYESLTLKELMATPLPPISYQRKMVFRPTLAEAKYTYNLLNKQIFANKLRMPTLDIGPRRRKYWGMCVGSIDQFSNGSFCTIKLMDKWYCRQWFITILAHEMAHQYQWDVNGPKRERTGKDWLMSHGPSFFEFRNRLAEHDIPLKTAQRMRRWFKYQDLFKT